MTNKTPDIIAEKDWRTAFREKFEQYQCDQPPAYPEHGGRRYAGKWWRYTPYPHEIESFIEKVEKEARFDLLDNLDRWRKKQKYFTPTLIKNFVEHHKKELERVKL